MTLSRLKVAVSPVSIMIGILVWAVGSFIVINIFPPGSPLTDISTTTRAYTKNGFLVVEYDRQFNSKANFDGTISRLIVCNGYRTFDVADVTRRFTKGQHKTYRTFSIPYELPAGSLCYMQTYVTWTPLFSMHPVTHQIVDSEFIVGEK